MRRNAGTRRTVMFAQFDPLAFQLCLEWVGSDSPDVSTGTGHPDWRKGRPLRNLDTPDLNTSPPASDQTELTPDNPDALADSGLGAEDLSPEDRTIIDRIAELSRRRGAANLQSDR